MGPAQVHRCLAPLVVLLLFSRNGEFLNSEYFTATGKMNAFSSKISNKTIHFLNSG
jgi:hypothetical protein